MLTVVIGVAFLFSLTVLVGAYRQLVDDDGAGTPSEPVTTA